MEPKFMPLPMFARTLLVCWMAATPALVFGQTDFVPQGGEYAIAGYLPGDQTFPQAAISPTGGVLVWQDNSVGTNGLRIRAVALNGSLTASGSPFVVSSSAASKSTGDQERPQVALLNNGGAIIVWQGGKYGLQKIYARFIGANGLPVGKDMLVNTYTKNYQINPAVAVLADGSVVVVWSSYGEDGSMQGIFGQRLSATGSKLGKEFPINQTTLYNQRTPAVVALANGNFVVAWVTELQRGPSTVDVYARIFSSAGAVSGEFPVNTSTSNLCANPSLAASPQGGFAVAWSQNDNVTLGAGGESAATTLSTNGWDVFGGLFDLNGNATTPPFRLNAYTFGDQYAPRISALGTNYMAVWTSLGQDGSWEGVYGQFITGSGVLESANDIQVNTTTISHQIQPTVASDGVNRFLAVWSSFVGHGTSFDLFAQKYVGQ
jgi:hypothetical protein